MAQAHHASTRLQIALCKVKVSTDLLNSPKSAFFKRHHVKAVNNLLVLKTIFRFRRTHLLLSFAWSLMHVWLLTAHFDSSNVLAKRGYNCYNTCALCERIGMSQTR